MVEKHLPELSVGSLDRALRLWDQLLEHFRVGGEAAAESGVGDPYIGGEPQQHSRRTHEHAINSPIGCLTQALLKMLGELRPAAGAGLPDPIRSRLCAQLATLGAARDYSLSVIALNLGWLHFVDPEWARVHLLPLFDPAGVDAEPAWSGYTYDQSRASPELFEQLKPHFLAVFPWLSRWRWDDGALRHFIELLVVYCYWHQNGGRYVTYAGARAILQQTTDMARAHAVWTLTRVVKDQRVWPIFGKAFLENAWPRERRFQTDATSRQLAELARGAGDEFPDAVATVVPQSTAQRGCARRGMRHAQFRSDWGAQVRVHIYDRKKLESWLGIDLLIYLELYRAYILVQYKMMKKGNVRTEDGITSSMIIFVRSCP